MLTYTDDVTIQCPYCGESFDIEGKILDNRHNFIDCIAENGCGKTFVVDIKMRRPIIVTFKLSK